VEFFILFEGARARRGVVLCPCFLGFLIRPCTFSMTSLLPVSLSEEGAKRDDPGNYVDVPLAMTNTTKKCHNMLSVSFRSKKSRRRRRKRNSAQFPNYGDNPVHCVTCRCCYDLRDYRSRGSVQAMVSKT